MTLGGCHETWIALIGLGFAAAAEALRGKTVDFVVSGPAEYVVINKLTSATPLIGLGRPDYHCAIVVRADSGINVPADLKGKKVAFGDMGSTSNMLCPMQLLADYGVDPVIDIEKIHTSRNIANEGLKLATWMRLDQMQAAGCRCATRKPTSPTVFSR